MGELSLLQRRILAILEEAGEDNLSALINTVNPHHASVDDLDTVSTALSDLVSSGLVNLARVRDEVSRGWIPLPFEDSIRVLANLRSVLSWSAGPRVWVWQSNELLPRVVVTKLGEALARKVLAEDGYPA